MGVSCPNKKSREWKMLEKQVGPELADITYISNGYNIPDVKTITETKKELGFKTYVENLTALASRVKRYNEKNGTSHYFTKESAYGNTFKVELKLNYLPVSLEKRRRREARRDEIYRVEELDTLAATESFANLYGEAEPVYTPSPSEMEAGRFNDEGDFVPVDDVDYLITPSARKQVAAVESQKMKALKTKLNEVLEERRKADDSVSLRIAEGKLAQIKRTIERSKESKVTATKLTNFEGVLGLADQQLDEIDVLLQQPIVSYSDILYSKRALNLWIAAGDQRPEPGLHLILDEDERNTPDIVSAFAERRARAELLQQKVDVIAKNHMTSFVQEYTSKSLTKEEIFKNLKDINRVAALTLNLGRTEDALLQAIFGAVETANKLAQDEANEVWAELDNLGEKVLPKLKRMSRGNPYDIFKQITKNGNETGRMVHRFSAEYFDTSNDLLQKAFHQRDSDGKKIYKRSDIDAYYKWLGKNTISMDVRILMPDSLLEDSETPTEFLYTQVTFDSKDAHIAELKQQLGEKGFEKYILRLEKKIKKWQIKRDAIWASISLQEELSDDQKKELFTEWNKEHSPYWALDMAQNVKSRMKPDGKSFYAPKGLRDYTYQIPRRVLKTGEKTEWYDKNFDRIEADDDLLTFHELITETLYQLKPLFPESKQKLLGINILPTIQKSLMDQFQDKGMMMGVLPFWDKMKSLITTTDLSQVESKDQDPLTGLREKHMSTQFIDDVNSKVRDIVKERGIKYTQENGKAPDVKTIKRFREEAKDYLSKQKSWDLVKIMKAYSMMALAYKHKSFIEPQIKLAEQFFNTKKEFVQNKAGKVKSNPDSVEEFVTKEGLKNYKDMLEFFLDSAFYSTGGRKVEGATKKKLYSNEDKKRKKELEELLENTTDEKQKEFLEEQIENLGSVITASGVGDAALKFMTLKGLGWNVFSGASNIGFGVISNIIESSDKRNYTGAEMRRAYMLTLNSVGKNLSDYTPFSPPLYGENALKIRQLMDQWDLLKTSNKELYDMSNQSSFGKGLKKFGPMTIQERTEYLNYAPTMIAVMLNLKATSPDGKKVNIWEAYDTDGKMKEGYTAEGTEEQLVRKIRRVIEMNHGDYNNPLMAKKTFTGRALSQFRTWMFEGFANRFEKEKTDYALSYGLEEDYVRKGRYRSYTQGQLGVSGAALGTIMLPGIGTVVVGALGYIAGGFFGLDTEQNGLSDTLFTLKQLTRKLMFKKTQFGDRFSKVDAANMRKNMTELYMYISLIGATLLLKAIIVDDDEEKEESANRFLANFLLNQSTRLQTDILFYTSPGEFEKLTKTAVPLAQLITDIGIWAKDVGHLFDDDPKNDVFQSGSFKGQSKSLVHFGQMLPGTSQGIRLYRMGTRLIDTD